MPHSRPMATQQMETDGELWFFTGWNTLKAREVEDLPLANLAYANPDGNTFVSVSGQAHIPRDREKMEELWSPSYKTWFPQGLDDPDLAFLKVTVEQVEYWDQPSAKMVQLAGWLKSAFTGRRSPGSTAKCGGARRQPSRLNSRLQWYAHGRRR